MNEVPGTGWAKTLKAIRGVTRAPNPPERCELCSIPIQPIHRHLLELDPNQVLCACDGCALRFEAAVGGRFKLIPRQTRRLDSFQITEAAWESLALPIDLAFFFYRTPLKRIVAMYPSAGGPMESLLPLNHWQNLVEENTQLNQIAPDTEAFLVNRLGQDRDYFIAPIDVCYELTGLIRLHWRGLSGGEKVWSELKAFMDRLRSSEEAQEVAGA